MFRLNVNSTLAARAERLAWKENLRGYDAVQLASALGLFPEDLPDVLDA